MNFKGDIFELFDKSWALLTAGSAKNFNAMTISWGELGTLWNKPVATVYVKPVRYTHAFMEKGDFFSIGFFDEKYRAALNIFGSCSGRDCNKPALSNLTPRPEGKFVVFDEASVTLLCKKIYRQDLDLPNIPYEAAKNFYQNEAPHTMYIGEVLNILQK